MLAPRCEPRALWLGKCGGMHARGGLRAGGCLNLIARAHGIRALATAKHSYNANNSYYACFNGCDCQDSRVSMGNSVKYVC